MLFAAKGIFAKKLYALGVGVEGVVAIRAMISLPLFWWFALRRERWAEVAATPPRAIIVAAAAGALCYYVGALLDFLALTMIDASIERVLIFSYPAMVVIFTSVRDRCWPARSVLGATALTYLGIFFTMGGFDLAELRANLLGALLVIGSALTYAIYFLVSEKYTRSVGSARFTLLAMTAATVCLTPHRRDRCHPGLRLAAARRHRGVLHVPARLAAGRGRPPRRRAARGRTLYRRAAHHGGAGRGATRRAALRVAVGGHDADRARHPGARSGQGAP
jgi:threonine/homoserine efflux transporter RhtA